MSLPERPLSVALQLATETVAVEPEKEYAITGIYSFGRGLIRRPTIRGSETAYPRLTRLRAGEFTMSKLNGWEGALAVVPGEFEGSYVSPEYPVFDIDTDVADPTYLTYLAKWPILWDRLTPRGSMVRRKRIVPATILATAVPLPDLPEQRRIAARLDSSFRSTHMIGNLQEKAASLRAALIDTMLSNAGEPTPLSAVLRTTNDRVSVDMNSTYQMVGILSFGRGLFSRGLIDGSETSYQTYNRIHSGQFLYSKLFGWEGALAVVPPEFDGYYTSHEFPAFEIDTSRADPSYVGHLAAWPRLHNSLRDKGTGMGSRRQRVNPDRLLATTIPLPSLPEQRRVAHILDRVVTCARSAGTQEANAKKFQAALLNAAFAGEL